MQFKTFFDNEGRIVSSISGDLSIMDLSQWNELNCIEEGSDPDTQWVSDNIVKNKLENPAYLEGLFIKNIPINGILLIDTNQYEITESEVELDLSVGNYNIKLDCFPYLPKTFEVIV